MGWFKKMFKGRFGMIAASAFAVLTIGVCALSTAAWFTIHRSQAIETGMITGSGEVSVGDINGYKVEHKRKPNGFINYDDTTVTKMNYDTKSFDTENSNQEDADINFDIPGKGIGYYFIPAVNDTYKYANGKKMNSYSGSDSNLAYLDNYVVEENSFRVRQYGFQTVGGVTETVSKKLKIENAFSTDTSKLEVEEEEGDLIVTLGEGIASATCKIWLDFSLLTISFEVKSTTAAALGNGFAGPNVHNLYGEEDIFFKPNSNWTQAGATFFIQYWNNNESNLVLMKHPSLEDQDCYVARFNVTTFDKCLFVRMPSGTTEETFNWNNKWNQSSDIDIPVGTSTNRLYIQAADNWDGSGSWGNYGTDYSRTYKMTIDGGNPVTLEHNDAGLDTSKYQEQYVKTGVTVTAGQTFAFTLNKVAISVAADSFATNLNGLTVKYGGTVDVYLKIKKDSFPNADLYISEPALSAKMVVGGAETAMNKTPNEEKPAALTNGHACHSQYYITGRTLAKNNTLSFKINGTNVTLSRDSHCDNLNDSFVVQGGGKVDIYLKVDATDISKAEVYISDVYMLTIGGVEFQLDQKKKSEISKHTEMYTLNGIAASKDDVVSDITLNGTTIDGWAISTSAGNNVDPTTKKILKTCSGEGAYFDIVTNTLWVTGNKKYTFKTYDPDNAGETTSETEMNLCESGDFTGWYTLANQSVTAGHKADIVYSTYDGDGVEQEETLSVSYASSYTVSGHTYANNNLSGGCLFLKTGTSSLYFDTADHKFYVTPVYSVTINGRNEEAVFQSGSTYQTDAVFDISGQDQYSVKVFINATEATNYTASTNKIGGVANNLTGNAGSLTTRCYSDSNVYAIVYSDSNTAYVSGYHDPVYTIKLDNAALETAVEGNVATATANLTAGQKLTFVKNKTNLYPAASGASNNVGKEGSVYTIINDATGATITWNLSDGTVFVSGRAFRYHFCNTVEQGSKYFSATPYAYLYGEGCNNGWPGIKMTQDTDGTYYADISFSQPYTHIIFNDYDGTKRQSNNLEITGNEGKYYWITDNSTGTRPQAEGGATYYLYGAWYEHAPLVGSEKTYYFHDKYISSHFGSATPSLYCYAFKDTYIPFGGAVFPGVAMNTVIPGSVYSISVPAAYETILFASSSKQTGNKTVSAVASGSIFLAREALDGSDNNNVTGAWGIQYSETGFGSANIKIMTAGGTERTTAYDSDGESTSDPLDNALRNGDTSNNYYIFEEGIFAKAGESFTIEYEGAALSNLSGTGSLDGNDFVHDDEGQIATEKYPWLEFANEGDTTAGKNGKITFAADGRYNFYVNKNGQISVAMVPGYGNGFYIMPYTSTTEGFKSAWKMNTVSQTSGSYTGFKVDAKTANKTFYFRSYLNAVDTKYTSFNIDSSFNVSTEYVSADTTEGTLTFKNGYSGYINIEIANKTVYVKPYQVGDFFKLDALDISNRTISGQDDIKAQKTSLVLEVDLHTDSERALDLYLDVGNGFVDANKKKYVGCAVYLTNEANRLDTPWEIMRSSHYSLSTDASIKFNGGTTSSGDYVAYILIDYYYDSTITDYSYLRVLNAQQMSFDIRTEKKAASA